MNIGIIGTGGIGGALARQFVAAGHDVTVANSRGAEAVSEFAAAAGARAASAGEASEQSVVVVAVPWSKVAAVGAAREDWSGRIVIDTTNPLEPPTFQPAELNGRPSTEVLAQSFPGARVVKALNTLSPETLARPARDAGGSRVIFISGDDPDANATVSQLVTSVGWAPIELGQLSHGGLLQQFPGGPLPSLDLTLHG
jgi:8-hydroxy-5-deazaflavin:NADPH oxidoreductase